MTIKVRELKAKDEASWRLLWQGYLEYYRTDLPEEITKLTWERLLKPHSGINGLCAVDERGTLIGIVHYLFHPVTWSAGPRCYLEDLFTSEQARGKGAGRALIEAVAKAARAQNADQVYWLTEEYNKRAQALYDKVARKTVFIKYQKDIE